MSFKRAPYPHEFRRQLVELVRSGRTPEEPPRNGRPIERRRNGPGRIGYGLPNPSRNRCNRLSSKVDWT